MRRLLALLLLLEMAFVPAPAVPASDTLAVDAEARWVNFDMTPGNQIRFTLDVDGKPVTAILDTGVSHSVMSRAFAESAGFKVQTGGTASAIGGVIPIGWVDTQSIALGGLMRRGGNISVATLPANATGSDRPIDMLVGRDLTGEYALDIDYDAGRFRLLPSGRLPFRGVSAPLSIAPDRQVYVSEVTLGQQRLRPMIVDTGDGAAITLSAEAWATAREPAPRTTTISYGLGGPIILELSILPEIRSGSLVARGVEVRAEPNGGFSQALGATGRIGSGFLQRYRVLLDPKAGRMVFAPGRDTDTQPIRSTSGLLVKLEKDRLRVLHVMRGGPAEASGWKAGDAICSVDGTAISANYPGSRLASWSIGAPGRTVALGLCGGDARALTLRRFY